VAAGTGRLPTMTRNLKLIFGDFLKSLRQLWLEVVGGIFLALGVVFVLAAIQEYRRYVDTPEIGTGRFLLVGNLGNIGSEGFAVQEPYRP
jgi:hypothetical protein